MNPDFFLILVGMVLAGAGLSALLIIVLKPLLTSYALARPNARSSHSIPTPQGGGIAVILVVLFLVGTVLTVIDYEDSISRMAWVGAATVFIAVIGAFDDIRPLPVAPRLLAQVLAVTTAVLMGRSAFALRVLPELLPQWFENVFLIVGGVWFVNLVNFMDGLDWLSVAEVVPVTAALVLLQAVGFVPMETVLVAAALLGAMIGFACFNKPVARLFLGDVGSLPIGLLIGWMLLQLAESGALTAALLLPLYYLMDATITLFLRFRRGEKLSQAHRSHFYQRATVNGHPVMEIVVTVFLLNVVLALLAASTYLWPHVIDGAWPLQVLTLIAGVAATAFVLYRFATPVKGRESRHA